MNKLVSGIIGLVLGIVLTLVTMWNMAPGMMMLEDLVSTGDFDTTVATFEKSVKDHGWSMPKVYDLKKTMKKYGHDVMNVKVFELCHPDHASKILYKDDERIVSSLMPCRIAIYEKSDGKVYTSRMASGLMASMMAGIIPEVMAEASTQNEEILNAILK